ncbi:hypothetical protein FCH28_09185 [Streptomyces piniterrae]|uniref:Uncharacterized protein n=1 Tax=Streptomyces piniterrae TaxID=2571125 RepID=A0A4V5MLF4_9ACTN|nr:hypothetical protein [Streptomyces piniterrae]TJZ55518.1 hypothetical protein FCH28_09185 [Streptomyces piniterrae]
MTLAARGRPEATRVGRRAWRLSVVLRLAAVALFAGLWASPAFAAPAPGRPHPANLTPAPRAGSWVTCTVGSYVLSVHDIRPAAGSFRADLWVWSVCPDRRQDPMKLMEFTNANEITKSLTGSEATAGRSYTYMKVTGSFRVDWDTRSFPFDRHRLVIAMEPNDDIHDSRYRPDHENSSYAPDGIPGEWNATSFRLTKSRHTYRTTFGDPALDPHHGSTYDRLEARIDLARAEYNSFVKLAGPVYVAALITLMVFIPALDCVEVMLGRLGLLGAVLFAIVLNMQQSSATTGSETALTLTDKIHVLGLVFTLVMIGINVMTWTTSRHSDEAPDGERRWVITAAVVYAVGNLALITCAAMSG